MVMNMSFFAICIALKPKLDPYRQETPELSWAVSSSFTAEPYVCYEPPAYESESEEPQRLLRNIHMYTWRR